MTTTIARERRGSPAVAALLLLAVGYNFLLAMFNASVHPVGASSAYVIELAVYAGDLRPSPRVEAWTG